MFKWLRYAQRLEVAEEMLLKLDRKMDELELDYADMRARCKRLLDRTEKAAQRLEHPQPQEEPDAAAPGLVLEDPVRGRLLTSRQRQIQQDILRRRARLSGANGG